MRGSGRLTLNFWRIPNYLSPRTQADLTEGWRTYSVDMFVESTRQVSALPTVGITGEGLVQTLSLRLVQPARH